MADAPVLSDPTNLHAIRQWLAALCAWADVTPSRLARAAEIAPSTLNRVLDDPPPKHLPKASTLHAVRLAAERLAKAPTGDASIISAPQLVGTASDLPVYAAAAGGARGAMVLSQDPIEWVKRPEPLWNVPRGFGVLIVGDSMEPAYYQGDIVLVHPALPPQRESDVLVVSEAREATWGGAETALVKRLVRWNELRWRLREYNPRRREFELPRSAWPVVLRVVGKYHAR